MAKSVILCFVLNITNNAKASQDKLPLRLCSVSKYYKIVNSAISLL